MTTIEVMRKALEALEHAEKDAADFQRINTDQTGGRHHRPPRRAGAD